MASEVVNTTSPMIGRRLNRDINRLMASGYPTTVDDKMVYLDVRFEGPLGTAYQRGVWTVNVTMPPEYPLQSPRVRFVTKILHPNIDFTTGLVCMNVLKQAWSSTYDLLNIFETFLPQLLRNPNPNDPLNHIAAAMMKRSEQEFYKNVEICVNMYALPMVTQKRIEPPGEPERCSSDLSLSELLSDDDDADADADAGDDD